MLKIVKFLVTALIVVIVSEIAKKYGKIGALIGSLPIIAILTMIWLYIEKAPIKKIETYSFYTFWYVIPSLPMFLLFPQLSQKFNFWIAIGLSALVTISLYIIITIILKRFNIML